MHNGAIGKYNYSVNFIQEKELHESYLHFDVGDMLVLFSDGVSEAGRGVTTDAGWARQDIEDFYPAQLFAHCLLTAHGGQYPLDR